MTVRRFNPCFNGSVERGNKLLALMSFMKGLVSILVLMEVLREEDRLSGAGKEATVSILVLMEVLREAKSETSTWKPQSVSILVLMEVLREGHRNGELFHEIVVSILVLMEVLREVVGLAPAVAPPLCFNPCFNGSVERGRFC